MGDSSEEKEIDIAKLKVADLKRELKSRGLSTAGNKTELMERLQLVLKTDGSLLESDSVVAESDLLDDDEVLGAETEEVLDEELALLNKSDELINSSTTTITETTTTNKRSADNTSASTATSGTDKVLPPPAKKVVLNRTAAHTSVPLETKTEQAATPVSPIESEKNSESKRIVKISSLTAKERLEMRARKFGVEPSEAAKKEMRAARFGTPISFNNTSSSPILKTGSTLGGTNATDMEEKLRKRRERFGQMTPKSGNLTTNGSTITTNSTLTDSEAKKQSRAERFKI